MNVSVYLWLIVYAYQSWPSTFHSAAHSAAASLVRLIALAYLHCLITILRAVGVWLVDGVLFVSHSNSTLVVAEVIHSSVNVVVYHSACLQEGLLHIEVSLG